MKKYIFIGVVILALILIPVFRSCESPDPTKDPENVIVPAAQILDLKHQDQFTIGDVIEFRIKVNKPEEVTKLKVAFDNQIIHENLEIKDQNFTIDTKSSRVGRINIVISYQDAAGKDHQDYREIVMFSDISPELKMVQVNAEYKHNPKSYTQGLEFYKGNLFESTGQKGTSYIAEVDLSTGLIKRQVDLDPSYFGEGMTIINDTIYQITYRAGICKVYDLKFNYIKEFTYTGEGWGLTNNGTQLIMSNGSDEIVWRNRQTFAVEKRIQVYGNMESVVQLNELELIDDKLIANIYTDKRLVEFDTTSGKVISFIDCSSLVIGQPVGVDYLNGIAHDPISGKTVITGKLWPSLYEVSFK